MTLCESGQSKLPQSVWTDHDKKYFHILDTNTRELTPVHNPNTLHYRIRYDDTSTDYLRYDLSGVDNHFVKVQVMHKSDQFTFDKFLDRLNNRSTLEVKIAENFKEFVWNNVDDEDISVEDTAVLLDSYIDAVDTDLDKNTIKKQMSELMNEAQSYEIAWLHLKVYVGRTFCQQVRTGQR